MSHQLVMNADEIRAMLSREFSQVDFETTYKILNLRPGEADLSLTADASHLRPGGTVSGPAMMTLVDIAAYVIILAHLGPVALAVTTNLNINFLNKPHPGDLHCRCHLLKLGKRLVVTEATIYTDDIDTPAAHATATYSIPPRS